MGPNSLVSFFWAYKADKEIWEADFLRSPHDTNELHRRGENSKGPHYTKKSDIHTHKEKKMSHLYAHINFTQEFGLFYSVYKLHSSNVNFNAKTSAWTIAMSFSGTLIQRKFLKWKNAQVTIASW